MFPTFISILDIQSWWEVPSIAHFCSLFRSAFNLLDFDIEDLEEALLTDGTEENSWLQELIVRLLSGCLPNNEISTFNYQMFLRRLFRQKCQEHDQFNPFNTDVDFQILPLRTKVDILHALCDFRLDAEDVLEQLKNLEADSLRVEPLGYDSNESAYWYFYGTRLYREDFKTKNNKKQSIWQVICFTEDDWFQLTKKFKKSTSKAERHLYKTLSDNFLPELPKLFKKKERLARKRLLENQPRRTSSRIRKLETETDKSKEEEEEPIEPKGSTFEEEEEEFPRQRELVVKLTENYGKSSKVKEPQEEESDHDSVSDKSEVSYEMAKPRGRKPKAKQNKSQESTSSKDSPPKGSKKHKKSTEPGSPKQILIASATKVGRQTNNSLAAATGQILIEPVVVPQKKKPKTSQVFRQTDEDLQTGMHKILDYVKNHEDAWPFADPVDEDYAPNYYSVIRKPMDLQRMEERLDSGYYKNYSKFKNDFQLIIDNCRLYNGAENEYTEMVGNLLKVFERGTEKYLDQISSSEDEIAVELPESEIGCKPSNKKNKTEIKSENKNESLSKKSKRKPTLVAKTDKKRERSLSEESVLSHKSGSVKSIEDVPKEKLQEKQSKSDKSDKHNKKNKNNKLKSTKKEKPDVKKNIKEKNIKKEKFNVKENKDKKSSSKEHKEKNSVKEKNTKYKKSGRGRKKTLKREKSPSRSPAARGRSRSLSQEKFSDSPPPSSPPSSPDQRFNFSPKKTGSKRKSEELSDDDVIIKTKTKVTGKHKHDNSWKDMFENEEITERLEKKLKRDRDKSPTLSPKPKDKHNKLRETIEKLKAKSEISHKLSDYEFSFDELDMPKENQDRNKHIDDKNKSKNKVDKVNKISKKIIDFDDGNSTVDSVQSESKKQKKVNTTSNKASTTKSSAIEALTLATEQTLKDINKWLDDTPKFTEFSSESNSPSYVALDDFDTLASSTINKLDPLDKNKKVTDSSIKTNTTTVVKKDGTTKESKRRQFPRDPSKFLKRREVQRTIDRLQPGKSKGNLITNVQSANKVEEIFPLGPLSKIKDTKNSLIVKTNENAPKLSLGSVLDSFGKHKFIDDQKKEVPEEKKIDDNKVPLFDVKPEEEVKKIDEKVEKDPVETKTKPTNVTEDPSIAGSATPNLSAWFKAFGAPKMQPPTKKSDNKDAKDDETKLKDESHKVPIPDPSPNPDSPIMVHGQPVPRQRKISTGSSVSERSSFSQDMDSPRVGIDERLGAYPAPYPSPMHRSPSGASPVMASPRPDVSPKAAYPAFNGQIRVGFYQDTVSTKSSPDKSCSPKENPQSPHPQFSEHVYAPNTTHNINYTYPNAPYYSQAPNYSSSNPTPPYNQETSLYYNTNKSLTDQYQAKTAHQNYTEKQHTYENSPASNVSSPSSHAPQHSPSVENYPQELSEPPKLVEKPVPIPLATQQQNTSVFPVKKRAYSEMDVMKQTNPLTNRFDLQEQTDNFINRNVQDLQSSGEKTLDTTLKQQPQQKPYVHQNIPEPKPLTIQTPSENYKQPSSVSPQQITGIHQQTHSSIQPEGDNNSRNLPQYHSSQPNSAYQSTYNESNYPLNIPLTRNLSSTQEDIDRKIDMSKYTNMGYTGPEVNYSRNVPYNRTEINYPRPPSNAPASQSQTQPTVCTNQSIQSSEIPMRYTNPNASLSMSYKGVEMPPNNTNTQQIHNFNSPVSHQNPRSSADNVPSGYKPDVTMPRPTYNAPTIDVDQPLGLRGNIANLSHIVDRYNNDERMLSGLQASSSYYTDKGLGTTHMFNKPIATSASGLPMFSQPSMVMPSTYNQNMQATGSSMYNRQMTELQSPSTMLSADAKTNVSQPSLEKKSKKRKSSKTATPVPVEQQQTNTQGFQSYAGLKNNSSMEPSAISLKTTSVVPGSAFNFGPTPTGLGIGSGLYGDKDAYPNFLEEFRSAPNYYMAAAAAAHHRSTPEASDKQSRVAHQSSTPQATPGYPFIGPQGRPPQGYSLGGPFIPPTQAQLMDPNSPLYQHYLQAGVLNQGLLGPPGTYPPGYHPALSMRQPYDSMTRPSWL